MPTERQRLWLGLLTAAFAAISAAAGLFWPDAEPMIDRELFNAYGDAVELYGRGLYRHDSAFKAPILRGTDAVVLFLGVPMLLVALAWTRRGGLRAGLFLLGALTCLLYNAASLALGVAFNALHLVYVAYLSAALYAFVLTFASLDLGVLADAIGDRAPRRALAAFLALAALAALVWLPESVAAVVEGRGPHHLGLNTTDVTHVLDIGVIAPAACFGAVLALRRRPLAYPIAASILVLLAFIGAVVAGQTVMQWRAGIVLGVGELALYVAPFLALSGLAAALVAWVLRAIRSA
ncbi:MAG: hypothetical protein KF901_06365 [Myxococcales bacterium]|nr:hypothetical protein [Myxococcales bacterium]